MSTNYYSSLLSYSVYVYVCENVCVCVCMCVPNRPNKTSYTYYILTRGVQPR